MCVLIPKKNFFFKGKYIKFTEKYMLSPVFVMKIFNGYVENIFNYF